MGRYFSSRSLRALAPALLLVGGTLTARAPIAGAVATCDGKPVTIQGSSASETLNGTPGADVIDSGGGNDVINGGGGNDIICAGTGNDTIDGGTGTNTVSYEKTGAVNADLTTGTASGPGTDTLTNIQNLVGSPGDDTLTGSSGKNVIDGGLGNDTLDGGGGPDTVSFASNAVAVNANLATGVATGQGTDSLTGFANITGSSKNDTLTGNAASNTIVGGKGNDTIDGGGGSDTASFPGSTAVNANLATGTATGQGTDSLVSIENLIGSNGNDTLTGNAGNNTITGGKGNDTMDGGGGNDTAAFTGSTAVNANLSTGTATGLGTDTIVNFENLTGSSKDDTLVGNTATNTLKGGAGTDTCTTGGGNDHVVDCEIDNNSINPAGTVTTFDFTLALHQKIFLDSTAYNPDPGKNLRWSMAGPSTLFGTADPGLDVDTMTVPTAGVYTLTINGLGATDTGTNSFRLWTDVDTTAPITLNGASQSVNITTPGQRAIFTFTGTAGHKVSVNLTNPAWNHNDCSSRIRLVRPNGTELTETGFCPAGFLDATTLDMSGTWSAIVDPGGDSIGTATVNAYDVIDQTATIMPTTGAGASTAVSITAPGQNTVFSFTAGSTDQFFFNLTGSTFPSDCNDRLRLIDPNGNELTEAGFCNNTYLDATKVTGPGTWKIVVDPFGPDVGTGTLHSYLVVDQSQAITVNGASKSATITTPGQRSIFTFNGTSGTSYSASMSGGTFPSDCNDRIRLIDPNGNELTEAGTCGVSGSVSGAVLNSTGTWSFVIDPAGPDTGSATTFSVTSP